ncbi:MAG TPA: hypothetical protein V6C81_10680 [Planktothrix sp.]|jgi:hypothetical protein
MTLNDKSSETLKIAADETPGVYMIASGYCLRKPNGKEVHSTLGTKLTTFKRNFDRWRKTNTQSAKHPIQHEESKPSGFRYVLSGYTTLQIHSLDEKTVTQVLIGAYPNQAWEMWYCLEAALSSVFPRMSMAKKKGLAISLGKINDHSVPHEETVFLDGNIRYAYRKVRDLEIYDEEFEQITISPIPAWLDDLKHTAP